MSLTLDHTEAFDEVYSLAGALVTIGAETDVKAIVPEDFQTQQVFDENGTQQTVSSGSITVKTEDLPALTPTTTVTLRSIAYRIVDWNSSYLLTTLNLETP